MVATEYKLTDYERTRIAEWQGITEWVVVSQTHGYWRKGTWRSSSGSDWSKRAELLPRYESDPEAYEPLLDLLCQKHGLSLRFFDGKWIFATPFTLNPPRGEGTTKGEAICKAMLSHIKSLCDGINNGRAWSSALTSAASDVYTSILALGHCPECKRIVNIDHEVEHDLECNLSELILCTSNAAPVLKWLQEQLEKKA